MSNETNPGGGTEPLAIGAIVCGLASLPCLCFCYGVPFNVLAIVLGWIALGRTKESGRGGRVLAQAGIGLGILSLFLAGGMFVAVIALGVSGADPQSILEQFLR